MTETNIARTRSSSADPEYGGGEFLRYTGAVSGPFSSITWSETSTISDYVDSNFHDRRNNGEVFNNPCVLEVDEFSCIQDEDVYFSYWDANDATKWSRWQNGNLSNYALNYWGAGYDPSNCTAADPPLDVERRAKSRCLANVDSTPYEFAEDIGEIRETIEFLRNPIASIANVARAYKLKKQQVDRIKDAKKQAKALADLWNTYRFAFSPLLRSVMGVAEALAEWESIGRPARRTAHGKSDDLSKSELEYTSNVNGVYFPKYRKVCSNHIESHAVIYYEVSNPLADWRFKLGLRLKDIPVTLWNLYPLSFLYDRLWNISDMISGIVNFLDPNVTFLACSETRKQTKTTNLSFVGCTWFPALYQAAISQPDSVQWKNFQYRRAVWEPQVLDVVPPITWRELVKDITSITDLIAITLGRLL